MPSAFVPWPVCVLVFPSREKTARIVPTTLPPFLLVISNVRSSIFFSAAVSRAGSPLTGLSFPSNFPFHSLCVGLPSALTPSFVNLSPPSIASILLKLGPFGAGPGTYFDLARLTFQFPLKTSAANAPLAEKQKTSVPRTNILRFIGDSPLSTEKIGKRIRKDPSDSLLPAEW